LQKKKKKEPIVSNLKATLNFSTKRGLANKRPREPNDCPPAKKTKITTSNVIVSRNDFSTGNYVTKPIIEEQDSASEEESSSEDEGDNYGPTLKVRAKDGAQILLRNIPTNVVARDILMELFPTTPGVEQVSIQMRNGKSTGMADVIMSSKNAAYECVRSLRKVRYRGHDIMCSLVGTTKSLETAEVAEVVQTTKKRSKKKSSKREEEAPNQNTKSVELRLQSPCCIVPETRPWNWGKTADLETPRNYEEKYIPLTIDPENPEEVYYHVTLKNPDGLQL